MSDEIRCKRIINGRTYNTQTSTLLGRHDHEALPIEDALFKTRHGAYFFYRMFQSEAHEHIEPYSLEDAQRWMEKYCSAERVEAEFGEMPDAGDPEARITLRIPETLRRRIAGIAESREQSLNAWILRCLERAADAEVIS